MLPKIKLSESATDYIRKKLRDNPNHHFRLSIKKTGCSGYAYSAELMPVLQATDVQLNLNDVIIVIDSTWQHVMDGLVIDYQEENKTGLKQKRLVFNNPNESNRCGCGESFHLQQGS